MDQTHKMRQEGQGWAYALADAKRQLKAARRRVRELTLAVKDCEVRVRKGEPWPGKAASE